ncbi:MAG: hypothetical protein NVS2B12_21540 [Ktedonobacteraceae bacterium]
MSTEMEKSLDEMSLPALMECSVRELAKYRRKEASDDKYCLEIFRRAVVLHDNNAWIVLQRQFGENVRLWLGGHSHRELALRYESEQAYIDDAFRRFWQAVSDQSLSFASVASALSYLRLCLHCAIMDTLRSYARANVEPIPEHGHPDEPQVEDSYNEDELWEAIKSILPGAKEQRVAYLHFHCNLKPREIIRYCPGEFHNEEEIYRLKRNIIERVQRNANTIRWKLDGSVLA